MAHLRRAFPYILILPSIIVLLMVVAYPWIYNFILSTTDYRLYAPGVKTFTGLSNYRDVIEDPTTWRSLRITLYYIVVSVGLETLLGVAIALLLNKDFWERGPVRTLCLVPMMITPVAVGLIWRFMYSDTHGVINYLLSLFGLRAHSWLGDPSLALNSVVFVEIWQNTPFITLMILAGLQALPTEVYEAARIDGASSYQLLRRITLPLLKPVIAIAILFRLVFAIRTFDVPFMLLSGTGGPGNVGLVFSLQLYRTAMTFWSVGKAAVLSYVLLLMTLILCWPFMRVLWQKHHN